MSLWSIVWSRLLTCSSTDEDDREGSGPDSGIDEGGGPDAEADRGGGGPDSGPRGPPRGSRTGSNWNGRFDFTGESRNA